jgi:PAS domain-containing protein
MDLPEGTLIFDESGRVRFCSDALARLVGRRPMDLAGRAVWSLLPGWTPFERVPARNRAARLRVGDGSDVPVQVTCNVLHVPGGALYVAELHTCRQASCSEHAST